MKNNNITLLDKEQIIKRTYDENHDAERVIIVGSDAFQTISEDIKKSITEGVKNLKIEQLPSKDVEFITITNEVIVKEPFIIEVEKNIVVPQYKVIEIEKPIIIKETQFKEIERPIYTNSKEHFPLFLKIFLGIQLLTNILILIMRK